MLSDQQRSKIRASLHEAAHVAGVWAIAGPAALIASELFAAHPRMGGETTYKTCRGMALDRRVDADTRAGATCADIIIALCGMAADRRSGAAPECAADDFNHAWKLAYAETTPANAHATMPQLESIADGIVQDWWPRILQLAPVLCARNKITRTDVLDAWR
jgi:hypothetical protein